MTRRPGPRSGRRRGKKHVNEVNQAKNARNNGLGSRRTVLKEPWTPWGRSGDRCKPRSTCRLSLCWPLILKYKLQTRKVNSCTPSRPQPWSNHSTARFWHQFHLQAWPWFIPRPPVSTSAATTPGDSVRGSHQASLGGTTYLSHLLTSNANKPQPMPRWWPGSKGRSPSANLIHIARFQPAGVIDLTKVFKKEADLKRQLQTM